MKKTLIMALVAALTFTSCGCKVKANKDTTMKTMNITNNEFLTKVANYQTSPGEWKYLGDKPAIVDFYASWCGPCKSLSPILDELAEQYDGQIYIYKVNTETEQELASAFGIRSIPSLLFIPMDGKPQMATGAMPKSQLNDVITTLLLKKQ